MNELPHYTQDAEGMYQFHYDGLIEGLVGDPVPEICVLASITENTATLLKHGPRDFIQSCADHYESRLKMLGTQSAMDLLNSHVILSTSEGLTLEDLNKCLNICDFVGKAYKNVKNTINA